GSLQKWFGNALLWFNALQDATTRHVDNFLGLKCSTLIARNVTSITQEELDKLTSPEQQTPSAASGYKCKQSDNPSEDVDDDGTPSPFLDPQICSRPSDYLRSQCPLCFGGEYP
ncbi:hypothetical protein C0991_001778, partial [Blastosporella zonata]